MSGYEQKFVVCDCHTHALAVSLLEDGDDAAWDEIGISFWTYGHGRTDCWRERLRHIWNIVRRGHPYLDSVCLSREKARELGETLVRLAT